MASNKTKAEFYAEFAKREGHPELAAALLAAQGSSKLALAMAQPGSPVTKLTASQRKAAEAAGFKVVTDSRGNTYLDGGEDLRRTVNELNTKASAEWAKAEAAATDKKLDETQQAAADADQTAADTATTPTTAPAAGGATDAASLADRAANASGVLGSAGGTTEEQLYIGVPNEYMAPATTFNSPDTRTDRLQTGRANNGYTPSGDVTPQYQLGFERTPVGWSEDRIGKLQADMVAAGYLASGKYRPRMWDQASQAAYQELLADANTYGADWRATLDKAMDASRDAFEQASPLTIQLADPRDVAQTADETAARLLGRRFTAAERSSFVSSFHAAQSAAQTAAWQSQVDALQQQQVPQGVASTVYDAPSMGAAAEDYARRVDPGGVTAHGAADLYSQLLNVIGVNYG